MNENTNKVRWEACLGEHLWQRIRWAKPWSLVKPQLQTYHLFPSCGCPSPEVFTLRWGQAHFWYQHVLGKLCVGKCLRNWVENWIELFVDVGLGEQSGIILFFNQVHPFRISCREDMFWGGSDFNSEWVKRGHCDSERSFCANVPCFYGLQSKLS